MENISYVGLSQQVALQREMEVTANNIANMDTPGYKTQGVLFLEYINKGGDAHEKLKQVNDYGMYRDLSHGPLKQTFNKLDVGIAGEGYFAVQTPGGIRYTRDGGFALNANREIVTKDGYQVMSDGGGPIVIQADAADISINAQGGVATEKGSVGKLKVVTFNNEQNLKPVGNNLLEAAETETEKPVENARVEQGMIESSNVNPIVEMNKMIQISRMYEAAQNMVMNDHQRILSAISKLSQTS
jgi:flagellar basal-body rod protein FlgF